MRRKRKNINIRKLSRKSRGKKSAKSVAKVKECIQEKVEEEDEIDIIPNNNNDLKEIETNSSVIEPKRMYNLNEVTSLRNAPMMNNGSNYVNRSIITANSGTKESRRARSIKKPVNGTIKTLQSIYSNKPDTIFFQYPEY